MKKVVFFIALLIVTTLSKAQKGVPIYTINRESQAIEVVDSMINKIDEVELSTVDTYLYSQSLAVGKTNYTIKVAASKEGDKEYGFNVINILKNDQKVLELKDYDSWTYTYDGKSEINFRDYTDNRYFIPVNLGLNSKALVFIGWPYGGDLPYLTIIAFTDKDVKLVFNKRMDIKDINIDNGSYIFKVQTLLEEYDSSSKMVVKPTFAQILSRGLVLYFLNR